jgi:hypothetical protein
LFMLRGVPPWGLVSWFFVFVMLIEPKTSGFGTWRGLVFGSMAGLVSFLVFTFLPAYDCNVAGLFAANLMNPFLEKIRK